MRHPSFQRDPFSCYIQTFPSAQVCVCFFRVYRMRMHTVYIFGLHRVTEDERKKRRGLDTKSARVFGQIPRARKQAALLSGLRFPQLHGSGGKESKRISFASNSPGELTREGPPSLLCLHPTGSLSALRPKRLAHLFYRKLSFFHQDWVSGHPTWPHVTHCFSEYITMVLVYNCQTPLRETTMNGFGSSFSLSFWKLGNKLAPQV